MYGSRTVGRGHRIAGLVREARVQVANAASTLPHIANALGMIDGPLSDANTMRSYANESRETWPLTCPASSNSNASAVL